MNARFRAFAKLDESTLHVVFRDPALKVSSVPIKIVVDLDEFGSPSGIEILGFEDQVGPNSADGLFGLVAGSDVRFSYDSDTDSAAIGLAVGTGTRTAKSVPKHAQAGLDASGRIVTIEVVDL